MAASLRTSGFPGTTLASRWIQLPTAWAPTTLNGISRWTEPGRVRITLRPLSRMVCVEVARDVDAVSRALGVQGQRTFLTSRSRKERN